MKTCQPWHKLPGQENWSSACGMSGPALLESDSRPERETKTKTLSRYNIDILCKRTLAEESHRIRKSKEESVYALPYDLSWLTSSTNNREESMTDSCHYAYGPMTNTQKSWKTPFMMASVEQSDECHTKTTFSFWGISLPELAKIASYS